jgi:hypothetical protein
MANQGLNGARAALLAATLAFGFPALASAQQAPPAVPADPTQAQFVALQPVLAHIDQETQALATLTNHIAQDSIAAVPLSWSLLTPAQRRTITQAMTSGRTDALQSAMSKAIVATTDRPNGVSEDQVTLLEYVRHLGIDPKNVIAVDVRPDTVAGAAPDKQNARVTIFYRRGPVTSQPAG